MVRPIVQLGDPRLRARCVPVEPGADGVGELVVDLRDTVRHSRASSGYGRAIAAPQIGVAQRVVYVDLPEPLTLVNPVIVTRSADTIVVWDACLSFLEVFCQVVRHREVGVRFRNLDGSWQTLDATDSFSELLQHEIDHLDGILAVDRMLGPQTLCLREQFEARYAADTAYAGGENEA